MKRYLLAKILIFHLILFAFAPNFYAQTPKNETPGNQNTEVLGENERLPFMQNEQNLAPEEPGSGGLLLKTLGSMILIVGLIFFGAWAAKKLGFGGLKATDALDDLAILSTISLGGGKTISTIRFGERILVVGSTAQSFTLLAEERSGEKSSLHPSRSVAEMLAEESDSFADEFEQAQTKLGVYDRNGGQI